MGEKNRIYLFRQSGCGFNSFPAPWLEKTFLACLPFKCQHRKYRKIWNSSNRWGNKEKHNFHSRLPLRLALPGTQCCLYGNRWLNKCYWDFFFLVLLFKKAFIFKTPKHCAAMNWKSLQKIFIKPHKTVVDNIYYHRRRCCSLEKCNEHKNKYALLLPRMLENRTIPKHTHGRTRTLTHTNALQHKISWFSKILTTQRCSWTVAAVVRLVDVDDDQFWNDVWPWPMTVRDGLRLWV